MKKNILDFTEEQRIGRARGRLRILQSIQPYPRDFGTISSNCILFIQQKQKRV